MKTTQIDTDSKTYRILQIMIITIALFAGIKSFSSDRSDELYEETIQVRCSLPSWAVGIGRAVPPDSARVQNYINNKCLKNFPNQRTMAVIRDNNSGLGCRSTETMKTPHVSVTFNCVETLIEANEQEVTF